MTTPDRPPALASLSRLHLLRLALSESLRTTGHYLWSGWGSIAAICLFLTAWDATATQLGTLILPTPIEALRTLQGLLQDGSAWPEIVNPARRTLIGFGL